MNLDTRKMAKIGLRALGVVSLVTWRIAPAPASACQVYTTTGCHDPNGGAGYICQPGSNNNSQGWYSLSPVNGDWPCCDVGNPTCSCPPPAPPDCP
jgi:hypothetical protein